MLILNFMIFIIPWCQIVISHLLKKKNKGTMFRHFFAEYLICLIRHKWIWFMTFLFKTVSP